MMYSRRNRPEGSSLPVVGNDRVMAVAMLAVLLMPSHRPDSRQHKITAGGNDLFAESIK